MPSLKFNHNYNNKLNCGSFTTIRLSGSHYVGEYCTIWCKKQNYGIVRIEEIRTLKVDQLNEFIARIDTGRSLAELKEVLNDCYPNTDWKTQTVDLLLCVKQKEKVKQDKLF